MCQLAKSSKLQLFYIPFQQFDFYNAPFIEKLNNMWFCHCSQQIAIMGNKPSRKREPNVENNKPSRKQEPNVDDNALECEFAQNYMNWIFARNYINEMPIVNYNHYIINMRGEKCVSYFDEHGKYLSCNSNGKYYVYQVDCKATIGANQNTANAFLKSCEKLAIKHNLPVTSSCENLITYNLHFPCPNLNVIVKNEMNKKIFELQQYLPENIQRMKNEVCNIKNVISQRTQQLKHGIHLPNEMQNLIDTTMALNVRMTELNKIILQSETLDYSVANRLALLETCMKLLYIPNEITNNATKSEQEQIPTITETVQHNVEYPDVPTVIPVVYPTVPSHEIAVIATVVPQPQTI